MSTSLEHASIQLLISSDSHLFCVCVFLVSFLLFVLCCQYQTASDCLEGLVSELTYYKSSGTCTHSLSERAHFLKNNPAKFHPDPIWNDGGHDFVTSQVIVNVLITPKTIKVMLSNYPNYPKLFTEMSRTCAENTYGFILKYLKLGLDLCDAVPFVKTIRKQR